MMSGFKFGSAINCIDGRTQQVVTDYMKQNYRIDRVYMVTFPGADGIFTGEHSEEIAPIKKAVPISIEKHGSRIIAIVGHHDCAGNPAGDREDHYSHIQTAVREVSLWGFPGQVVGLFVNDNRKIEKVG